MCGDHRVHSLKLGFDQKLSTLDHEFFHPLGFRLRMRCFGCRHKVKYVLYTQLSKTWDQRTFPAATKSRPIWHGCTKPLKSTNCTYGFGNPPNPDLFTSIETDSRVGEAWGVRLDALAGVMLKCPAALVVAVWDGVPSG